MRFPIGVPVGVKNVKVFGPKGSMKTDMMIDTGAMLTTLPWWMLRSIGLS